MKSESLIVPAFILVMFLLGTAQSASACSCMARPSVLDEFERSDDVIIAEITSIEKAGEEANYLDDIKGAKMVVKKVFKGELKEGDELFFEQGGGANCIWTYRKEMIGQKVLIYNSKYEGKRFVSECGRSNGLAYVHDDLLYLENLDKVRDKTRVSGQYKFGFFGGVPDAHFVEGKKIKVFNKDGAFYAVTDSKGIYELYDLAPGDYFIEPEMPRGWKLNDYMMERASGIDQSYIYSENKIPNRFPIRIEASKHVSVDFQFEIDNSIRGRVLDPAGKPMKGICVTAVSADATEYKNGPSDCTDKNGRFSITELYRKNVVLVINGDGEVSGDQPISMLFYPGVAEQRKASIIEMEEGRKLTLPDFRVPKLVEAITLSGVLRYTDGSLVTSHQKVQFIADQKDQDKKQDPYDYTDDHGRFEIKILKGQRGKIRGSMIFGERHLDSCADLHQAVIEKKWGIIEAATPSIDILANKNEMNLVLTFAFPECAEN